MTLQLGGTSSPVSLTVNAINGFNASVTVSLQVVPQGITAAPPGPFQLSPGQSQDVTFSAAANMQTSNITVDFTGDSGSLTHTARAQLNVVAAPLRSTFVRVDTALTPGGGLLPPQLVYDPQHKYIFAADPNTSSVQVFSSLDGSRIASLSVPNPASLELSLDGSRVWVATYAQQIIGVDTSSLRVVARVPIATVNHGGYFNQPRDLVFASNGKALISMGQLGLTGGLLVFWDPSTNSFTPASTPIAGFDPGLMARSADGSKVIVGSEQTTGEVILYDAASDAFTKQTTFPGSDARVVAASPDGTQFAIFLNPAGSIQFMDANLGVLKSVNTNLVFGMVYSTDGHFLFYRESSPGGSGQVKVIDTTNFALVGSAPDIADSAPQAVDNTSMIFAAATRGVTLLDASHPAILPTNGPVFATPTAVNPAQGSAVAATPVVLSGQGFESSAQVSFGSQIAAGVTVTNTTTMSATVPPAASGPVNVSAYFPSGWMAVAPEAFTYGPQVLALRMTAGPTQGGSEVQIFGYGFGSNAKQVTVKLGTQTATVTQLLNTSQTLSTLSSSYLFFRPTPFPVQRLTIITPPGSPGSADLTVKTPSGTTTAPAAFQYLQNLSVFPFSGKLRFVSYDRPRQRVYMTNTQEIEVFDLATRGFLPPLTPPGGPRANSDLYQAVLSPDGSKLAVADFGAQAVYILDPDSPGVGSTVTIPASLLPFPGAGPARLAITSTGKIFVAITWGGSGSGAFLDVIDIATGQISLAMQSGAPVQVSNWSTMAADSLGDVVCASQGNSSDGPVLRWDATSGRFASTQLNTTFFDTAISADGLTCAAGGGGSGGGNVFPLLLDSNLIYTNRIYYPDYQYPEITLLPGLNLHPSGSLLYQPNLIYHLGIAAVDILDAHEGRLRERVLLSEGFPQAFVQSGMNASYLALDETGQTMFVITQSGLTIAQLAVVPLSIGEVTPLQVPAAGGSLLTIHGSGYTASTNVSFEGIPLVPIFIDSTTLQVATPSVPPGAVRLTITNPGGSSYSLDAALVAK